MPWWFNVHCILIISTSNAQDFTVQRVWVFFEFRLWSPGFLFGALFHFFLAFSLGILTFSRRFRKILSFLCQETWLSDESRWGCTEFRARFKSLSWRFLISWGSVSNCLKKVVVLYTLLRKRIFIMVRIMKRLFCYY